MLGDGNDQFSQFVYAAETRSGALAILTSAKAGKKVNRVFRSTTLSGAYSAVSSEASPMYRDDGLYKVLTAEHRCPRTGLDIREHVGLLSLPVIGALYKFQFERVDEGNDSLRNALSAEAHIRFCVRVGTMQPMTDPAPHVDPRLPTKKRAVPVGSRLPQQSRIPSVKKPRAYVQAPPTKKPATKVANRLFVHEYSQAFVDAVGPVSADDLRAIMKMAWKNASDMERSPFVEEAGR